MCTFPVFPQSSVYRTPNHRSRQIADVTSSNSLWLAVEANISIIAACLPTLGGFLKGRLESRVFAGSKYPNENNVRFQSSSSSNRDAKKFGKGSPMASGDSSRNHWIPLRDLESKRTVVSEENHGVNAHGKGIMVQTTFTSEMTPA